MIKTVTPDRVSIGDQHPQYKSFKVGIQVNGKWSNAFLKEHDLDKIKEGEPVTLEFFQKGQYWNFKIPNQDRIEYERFKEFILGELGLKEKWEALK